MQRYRGRTHLETGEDVLGFTEISARLAQSLIEDQKFKHGIVLELEGKWGSGKTSLLALTRSYLEKCEIDPPVVVDFRPWLISDRDTLIAIFFSELSKALDQENAKDKKLTNMVRDYGRRVMDIGAAVADLGAAAGFTQAKYVKGVIDWAFGRNDKRLLPQIKEALDRELQDFGRKIVVTIDDIDRLEPREISEVLRLVRSVADFGSIIYILCYDPKIITEAIANLIIQNPHPAMTTR
jgi:predicted KAP-like P-loop ATPase